MCGLVTDVCVCVLVSGVLLCVGWLMVCWCVWVGNRCFGVCGLVTDVLVCVGW